MGAPTKLDSWLRYPFAALTAAVALVLAPMIGEAHLLLAAIAALAPALLYGIGPGLVAAAFFSVGAVRMGIGGPIAPLVAGFVAAGGGARIHYAIRKAERARRTAEEKALALETVFESMADGFFEVDRTWRLLLVNREAERLLGRARERLLGRQLWKELGGTLTDPFENQLREAQEKGRAVGFTARYGPLDRWFEVRAFPSPRGLSVFFRDATERMQRESSQRFLASAGARLGHTLDWMETLAEAARLVVLELGDFAVVDLLDGDVFRRVRIAHRSPLVEELVRPLLGPVEPSRFTRAAMNSGKTELVAVVTPATIGECDHTIRSLVPRSLMVLPLQTFGRVVATLTVGNAESCRTFGDHEVALGTELARRASAALENARLYEDAQQAIRVRDEFVSIASHELKTPLTTLQLQVQSMLRAMERSEEAIPPAQLERGLRRTARQVERLGRLIQELLDVSRISAGKLELERESMDLRELAAEVLSRFESELDRSGSTLTLEPSEPIVGRWDRFRLEQVLTNLVSNAIKYGAGRPIVVRTRVSASVAVVEVEDQGIGIPAEAVDRIFERFERAVSARQYGGLGLGLYICAQIVSAHGGRIGVRPGSGRGTVFSLELPRERPHAPVEVRTSA